MHTSENEAMFGQTILYEISRYRLVNINSTLPIVTVVVGCVAAGVVTMITLPKFLKRIKKKPRSPEIAALQDTAWTKIGSVVELYTYPVMYGREKEVKECVFQQEGLMIEDEGGTLRDKMFVVYDEETRCAQTYKNFTIMLRLKVTAPLKDKVCFKDEDETLLVDLHHNVLKKRKIVDCKVWNQSNETLYYIECVDCGANAAKWISNILTGKDSGLRLGYYVNKTLKLLTLWENFGGLRELKDSMKRTVEYQKDTNQELPTYTMVTEQSLEEVNKSLLRTKSACDIGANFVISITKPFLECQHEYFKIGNEVIIANMKPWKKPRINPISIPNDLKLKLMAINCKLLSSGKVKLNDDVYVHTNVNV